MVSEKSFAIRKMDVGSENKRLPFSVFYVFKGNKFVNDPEEARRVLIEATGIDVVETDHSKLPRDRYFGPVLDRVITSFENNEDDYEKYEPNEFEDTSLHVLKKEIGFDEKGYENGF